MGGITKNTDNEYKYVLARYDINGSLDTTFGTKIDDINLPNTFYAHNGLDMAQDNLGKEYLFHYQ